MKVDMTIDFESGKKIELNEDEARELWRKLNCIFGYDLLSKYTPYPTYPSGITTTSGGY
jgi:hypothetical protein